MPWYSSVISAILEKIIFKGVNQKNNNYAAHGCYIVCTFIIETVQVPNYLAFGKQSCKK